MHLGKLQHMDLTVNELQELLEYLDVQIYSIDSQEIRAHCPHPDHEDAGPSWYMKKSTGQFYCQGCGWSGNAFTLAKELTGQHLYTIFEKPHSPPPKRKSLAETRAEQRKARAMEPLPKVSIEIVGTQYNPFDFPHVRKTMRKWGVTRHFVEHFGLFHMVYGHINQQEIVDRLVFPIYENGNLVNVEARDVTGESSLKTIYPPRSTTKTLWNIDNLRKDQPLVVCEGIKDTIKLWQWTGENVTSIFGAHLNKRQIQLLSQFPELIVFPDNDKAGDTMVLDFEKHFSKQKLRVARIEGAKRDPNDATRKELLYALTQSLEPHHETVVP